MQVEELHWLNEDSKNFLNSGYTIPGETPEGAIDRIGDGAEKRHGHKRPGIGERVKYHLRMGHFSASSPLWANFNVPLEVRKGLPISCFGAQIGDSVPEIIYTLGEQAMMSYIGGGTSTYWGDVRGRGAAITGGSTSEGSFSFIPMYEEMIKTISQGGVRRGHMAVYQDIEHPDIKEWLRIQAEGNPVQVLTYGVCISDEWWESMLPNPETEYPGDPEKQDIIAQVLESREKRGLPYIFFKGNANRNKPEVYKIKNKEIKASNLCTEIMLPYEKDESFVCCLASMNIALYDSWKNTDAIEVLVYLLDAVLDEFTEKVKGLGPDVEYFLKKTVNFVNNHRALGIGALGWHSYLQSKMIPFGSTKAIFETGDIFREIQNKAIKASEDMVVKYGYTRPNIFEGTDIQMRHSTLTAVAPTKSSSAILGQVSPGIEPYETNYFVKDLAKTKTTFKNPYLTKLLKEKGMDNEQVWLSILQNGGSIQHLDFLDPLEKDVFRTFSEISQLAIIQQASVRQNYLCQGQSINLKILPSTPIRDVLKLIREAKDLGILSLYYQYSVNAAQAKFAKKSLEECDICSA